MGRASRISLVLVGLTAAACADGAPDGDTTRSPGEALREELLARKVTDQAIRDTLVQRIQSGEGPDSALAVRMQAVDSANTAWLKGVLEEHGWPGRSLVGEEAAHAAFLIVQHATHDPDFQTRTLRLLEEAAREGEASGSEVAYLADRIAVQAGRPQRYGSQFDLVDGEVVFSPIEDSANVDARRAEVGLPPLAVYKRQADSIFGGGG